MKLTLVSKVKEFKAKDEDGEPVGTLTVTGVMSPSEIGELARFLGRTIVVTLVLQQPGLFDEDDDRNRNGYRQGTLDEAVVTAPAEAPLAEDGRCLAPATHVIKYDAGDGRTGTLFACEAHLKDVTAMALEFCDSPNATGSVLAPEPLAEGERGKIACAYQGVGVQTDLEPPTCACGHGMLQHHLYSDAEGEPDYYGECTSEGCECEVFEDPGAPCVCGHRRSSHSIGLTCVDCACMAFRPVQVEPDPEAGAVAEAHQHERHMAEAATETYEEIEV